MLITVSKNSSGKIRRSAEKIAAHIPECGYIPRSGRAISEICNIVNKRGGKEIFVIDEKMRVRKYYEKEGEWCWDARSFKIKKIKFGKIVEREIFDMKLVAKNKEGKDIVEFLVLKAGMRKNCAKNAWK
ncbi:MAG: hypothetical protein ABIH83_01140 [Candidatus Micrarchaeota archaeon]